MKVFALTRNSIEIKTKSRKRKPVRYEISIPKAVLGPTVNGGTIVMAPNES